jgi:hypothetical protein
MDDEFHNVQDNSATSESDVIPLWFTIHYYLQFRVAERKNQQPKSKSKVIRSRRHFQTAMCKSQNPKS